MNNDSNLAEIQVVFNKDCTTMNKFIDFIINKLIEDYDQLGGFINDYETSNNKRIN